MHVIFLRCQSAAATAVLAAGPFWVQALLQARSANAWSLLAVSSVAMNRRRSRNNDSLVAIGIESDAPTEEEPLGR